MKSNSLICTKTQTEYPLETPIWQSEQGDLLDIRFKPSFDKKNIRNRPANLWRYREALPIISDENIVSFGEGATPLQKILIEGQEVHLKLDFLMPTGSYKDRGSALMISKAKELGIQKVVQDSSGNAGSSVAAYCAKANIACEIYVPAYVSETKLLQIKSYGAKVVLVEGTREQTAQKAYEAAKHTYYASHVWNPFFFQGTKTIAFEIAEQLAWSVPDTIVVPVGNGSLLIGLYIGFRELHKAGITDKSPKIIAVQAKNVSPLYQAFTEGLTYIPAIQAQETIAEGVAIGFPLRGKQILQYVELTGGAFLSVEEQEIKSAWQMIAQKGYFVEPTSAVALAGLRQYLQNNDAGEKIALILTGTGLKASTKIASLL